MTKRDKANYLIQSVCHAFDVLEEMARTMGEVGVTDLSKRLKLHKNNVFRLLATLELRGYCEQNADSENYRLGVKALQLGQCYLSQATLVNKGLPICKALADKIGETVSIAVLQCGQVQYPISIESKRPVRVAPRVAVAFPAKTSVAGRLLTAQLADAVLQEILAPNTPQDAAIRNQLNELRTTGQILDRGAIEPDVVNISRVIRGYRQEVIAAVEVLVPQYRAKTEVLLPLIEEATNTLSVALGSVRQSLSMSMEKEIIRPSVAPESLTSGGPASANSGMVAAPKIAS